MYFATVFFILNGFSKNRGFARRKKNLDNKVEVSIQKCSLSSFWKRVEPYSSILLKPIWLVHIA